jgi:predicted transcriptional regulator
MKVLLSIKPEFAEKIFDGSKKYEFRRAIFKDQNVKTIVVYAPVPVKMIIGEFAIEDILFEEIPELWERARYSGSSDERAFYDYFIGKSKGYAIKISNPLKYREPLTLSSFGISKAPQFFIYLW